MTDKHCGCGCNHDHHDHNHEEMQEFETMTLTLDDDTELECIVLGTFDFQDSNYIALLPADEGDGEDVYIYEYKELNEEEVELNVVEDDELFEQVAREFENRFVEVEEDGN
ncbi:MAG: DUF1292 domain-containing protein [Tissierellia bacterium]|nr:DUF1292 domain-containing protein [Tissierellia bacterium]